MSENLTTTPTPESHETLPSGEAEHLLRANTERLNESAKAEKDPGKALNEATVEVNEIKAEDHRSNPLDRLKAAENAAQPAPPTQQSQELRQVTLQRELNQIRRKLPTPQRVLSMVIHQPVVRVVSEAAGKTVSRPSGMLGGGLVALAGTTTYLYLARHIGFNYNYGVFLVLFVGGFIVGIALELMVNMMTASHRQRE